MQENTNKKNRSYAPLIAFAVPFLLCGALGAWLGHSEFTESIAKNYLGQMPGKFDDLEMSSGFFWVVGIPAGILGLIIFLAYRLLRRVFASSKH